MTATNVILTEDHGAVRVLRMNRPDKLNALNTELTRALLDSLRAADDDDDVRAVVLTGAGRAFCAGADLTEFSDLTPRDQAVVLHRAELTSQVQAMPQGMSKPIVSVVQGAAVGGGAGLAIACDMMVVTDDVTFGYPELRHAIVPAIVMTGLQRHFGRKLAFELVSTGRMLGAAELTALGIAHRATDSVTALKVSMDIASGWASTNARAMMTAKSLFYRVADLPFSEAMQVGRDINAIMRGFPEAG